MSSSLFATNVVHECSACLGVVLVSLLRQQHFQWQASGKKDRAVQRVLARCTHTHACVMQGWQNISPLCPACVLLPQVPGAVNIAAIACGAFHNMALVADGRVLTWGTNDYGQLGNGSTIYSTTPVEVRSKQHTHTHIHDCCKDPFSNVCFSANVLLAPFRPFHASSWLGQVGAAAAAVAVRRVDCLQLYSRQGHQACRAAGGSGTAHCVTPDDRLHSNVMHP